MRVRATILEISVACVSASAGHNWFQMNCARRKLENFSNILFHLQSVFLSKGWTNVPLTRESPKVAQLSELYHTNFLWVIIPKWGMSRVFWKYDPKHQLFCSQSSKVQQKTIPLHGSIPELIQVFTKMCATQNEVVWKSVINFSISFGALRARIFAIATKFLILRKWRVSCTSLKVSKVVFPVCSDLPSASWRFLWSTVQSG